MAVDLSPYVLVRELGSGGFGSVYLVNRPNSVESAALKVLHDKVASTSAERFLSVGERLKSLAHTNVVQVRSVGRLPSGAPYWLMPALVGRDLAQVLAEKGALPHPLVLKLALQALAGLQALHDAQLLHLDLKANNLFLTNDAQTLTLLDVLGSPDDNGGPPTPEYLSPEQLVGQPVDARSDLYSLSVILYEALTGKLPFQSHSYSDVVAAHLNTEPPQLSAPNGQPTVPNELVSAVLRGLKKKPEQRFASAAEMANALRRQLQSATKSSPTLAPTDPSTPDSEDEALAAGTVLGTYRILELLGAGGMGRVYLAEHLTLGRRVALKLLRAEYASSAKAVKRFFAEARAVNQISHENIVEITDFVDGEGSEKYYIMELLKGQSLATALKAGPLAIRRAINIAKQATSALAAVHSAQIIHRDLKPDNIFLITRGGAADVVKLLDFGVAKLVNPNDGKSVSQTIGGAIMGTPEYMAPEQAGGKPLDHRADIYAFGVILFEMVTGRKPFEARSFGEMVIKHLTAPPPRPSKYTDLPAAIPAALEKLILACLAKAPEERPPNMDTIGQELAIIAAAEGDSGGEVMAPPRSRRALLVAACLVLVAGVAVGLRLFFAAPRPSLNATTMADAAAASTSGGLAAQPASEPAQTAKATSQPNPEPAKPAAAPVESRPAHERVASPNGVASKRKTARPSRRQIDRGGVMDPFGGQ